MTDLSQKKLTENLIYWLNNNASTTFVKASQDVARTRGQYGTVKLYRTDPTAVAERKYTAHPTDDTKLTETIFESAHVIFSIQVYRDADTANALDIATDIGLKLRTSDALEYFSINGMGLIRVMRAKGMDIPVENIMEPRAAFDVTFSVDRIFVTEVDRVEGVTIDATVTGGASTQTNARTTTRT